MTLRHASTLATLALASILSALATGALMDATRLDSLGIAVGTVATCGFLSLFGKLLERGAL